MTTKDQHKAHVEELQHLSDQLAHVLSQRQERDIYRRKNAVDYALDVLEQWSVEVMKETPPTEGRHLQVVVSDTGVSSDSTGPEERDYGLDLPDQLRRLADPSMENIRAFGWVGRAVNALALAADRIDELEGVITAYQDGE